jgi:V-type H+-transporting ATPase subunit d
MKGVEGYREIIKDAPDPQKKEEFSIGTTSMDDIMYEEEVSRYCLAFEG